MNDLATIQPKTAMGVTLKPETPAMALRRAEWRNALQERGWRQFSISSQQAPSDDERCTLRARLRELGEALAPCRDIDAVAIRMTRFFPKFGVAGRDPAGMVTAYTRDLVAYPIWAIEAACVQAVQSGKREFAPSSSVLIGHIREMLRPWQVEHAEIERLLAAEVVTAPSEQEREVSRQRVQAMAELAMQAIGGGKSREAWRGERYDPEADYQRLLAERTRPVALSPEARSAVRLPPQEEAA